jgi:hypothetical protein
MLHILLRERCPFGSNGRRNWYTWSQPLSRCMFGRRTVVALNLRHISPRLTAKSGATKVRGATDATELRGPDSPCGSQYRRSPAAAAPIPRDRLCLRRGVSRQQPSQRDGNSIGTERVDQGEQQASTLSSLGATSPDQTSGIALPF